MAKRREEVVYLDEDFNPVKKEDAVLVAVEIWEDDILIRRDFFPVTEL